MRAAKDKPPKSAGKSVRWGIRFVGGYALMSALFRCKSETCRIKRYWEENNPTFHYELVRITIEPVTIFARQ